MELEDRDSYEFCIFKCYYIYMSLDDGCIDSEFPFYYPFIIVICPVSLPLR